MSYVPTRRLSLKSFMSWISNSIYQQLGLLIRISYPRRIFGFWIFESHVLVVTYSLYDIGSTAVTMNRRYFRTRTRLRDMTWMSSDTDLDMNLDPWFLWIQIGWTIGESIYWGHGCPDRTKIRVVRDSGPKLNWSGSRTTHPTGPIPDRRCGHPCTEVGIWWAFIWKALIYN